MTALTQELEEAFEGAALADGLDDALVGLGTQFSHSVAVYDLAKCIDILVERDGMTPAEAQEFLDFNTLGAYAGESTPIFVHVWLDDHEHER